MENCLNVCLSTNITKRVKGGSNSSQIYAKKITKKPFSLKKNAIKTNVTSVKSKKRLSLSGWLNTQEAEALTDMKL